MSEKKFDPAASAARKGMPLFDGFLMYFPDAALKLAEFSKKANDKHNPGEPLHWSKHKSSDHANCVGRHLIDIGPDWDNIDPEFDEPHAVALAWRATAILQILLEAKRAGMKVRDYLAKIKREAEVGQPRGVAGAVESRGYNPFVLAANVSTVNGKIVKSRDQSIDPRPHCTTYNCAAPEGAPEQCGWCSECEHWCRAKAESVARL